MYIGESLNSEKIFFRIKAFYFLLPASSLWSTSLCHSLVRHTYIKLYRSDISTTSL